MGNLPPGQGCREQKLDTGWDDSSIEDAVRDLRLLLQQQQAEIERLRAQQTPGEREAAAVEASQRLRRWGRLSGGGYSADVVLGVVDWIDGGDGRTLATAPRPRPACPQKIMIIPRIGHVFRLAQIIQESCEQCTDQEGTSLAKAILEHPYSRWDPKDAPVPVSERLPGPEDLSTKLKYCWWWNCMHDSWAFCDASYCDHSIYTHWLPAHALPMPQEEVKP